MKSNLNFIEKKFEIRPSLGRVSTSWFHKLYHISYLVLGRFLALRMVSRAEKEIFRVIDGSGNAIVDYGLEDDKLVELYRKMALTRQLDAKILAIQRQGRIGPYVPCAGEEAATVASAFALQKDDWLFSSYRELGAHITRGLSVDLVLAQLFGNSNDLLKGRQMSNSWGSRELNDVPTAAPIGAYLPVAVGVSLAAKRDKKQIAVLTFLGDGGTSASDFHVAMNFAGVYRTPAVFFCRNNGWAISLPVSKQTGSETLAVKASAYGFEGLLVDGNDALAVYSATKKAIEKARSGGGPTFIEALTYRVGPHSTADDPARYRDKNEADSWTRRDPVETMKSFLVSKKLWDPDREQALAIEYAELISKSIERQESMPLLSPSELIFDEVYSEAPWFLSEQRDEFQKDEE